MLDRASGEDPICSRMLFISRFLLLLSLLACCVRCACRNRQLETSGCTIPGPGTHLDAGGEGRSKLPGDEAGWAQLETRLRVARGLGSEWQRTDG